MKNAQFSRQERSAERAQKINDKINHTVLLTPAENQKQQKSKTPK